MPTDPRQQWSAEDLVVDLARTLAELIERTATAGNPHPAYLRPCARAHLTRSDPTGQRRHTALAAAICTRAKPASRPGRTARDPHNGTLRCDASRRGSPGAWTSRRPFGGRRGDRLTARVAGVLEQHPAAYRVSWPPVVPDGVTPRTEGAVHPPHPGGDAFCPVVSEARRGRGYRCSRRCDSWRRPGGSRRPPARGRRW